MAIKNVTIAGASGSLGSKIFQKFISSGSFHIRVLKRAGSSSSFPAGTDVVEVDYHSAASLTAALKGTDFLVSTLGASSLEDQLILIDAAIAAGVQRFLPSEFGSDLDVPSVRALPVFAAKVKVQDAVIAKAKANPSFTYTFVYNAAFLDWGIEYGFLLQFAKKNTLIVEDGNSEFSATTVDTIADAVVGIAKHPEETKNRVVRIEDIVTSQNKLLALARQAAPSRVWEPEYAKLDDLTAKADERLAKGLYDHETFLPYLLRAVIDPRSKSKFEKTDNELLGLKGKTDEDVLAIIKDIDSRVPRA